MQNHSEILIGITQMLGLLLAGCIGVIAGVWATILSMRRRDDRIWEAITHPGHKPGAEKTPDAVITTARVRPPEPSVLAGGWDNPNYTPCPGLDQLEDTLTGMAIPGTRSEEEYFSQAAAMAEPLLSATVAPEPPVQVVPRASSTIDVWGDGRTVDDVLREIQEGIGIPAAG